MKVDHSHGNKQTRTGYFDYETFDSEPTTRPHYEMSPELEEELLDHSYFLKQRVWRQMKRLEKDSHKSLYNQPSIRHKHSIHRFRVA